MKRLILGIATAITFAVAGTVHAESAIFDAKVNGAPASDFGGSTLEVSSTGTSMIDFSSMDPGGEYVITMAGAYTIKSDAREFTGFINLLNTTDSNKTFNIKLALPVFNQLTNAVIDGKITLTQAINNSGDKITVPANQSGAVVSSDATSVWSWLTSNDSIGGGAPGAQVSVEKTIPMTAVGTMEVLYGTTYSFNVPSYNILTIKLTKFKVGQGAMLSGNKRSSTPPAAKSPPNGAL